MLVAERQQKLDRVLGELRQISGVEAVQSDDFDSSSVVVFITLRPLFGRRNGRYGPQQWERPLRSTKAAIAAKMRGLGVEYRTNHQPVKRYEGNGSVNGERIRHCLGYDRDDICLDIYL